MDAWSGILCVKKNQRGSGSTVWDILRALRTAFQEIIGPRICRNDEQKRISHRIESSGFLELHWERSVARESAQAPCILAVDLRS